MTFASRPPVRLPGVKESSGSGSERTGEKPNADRFRMRLIKLLIASVGPLGHVRFVPGDDLLLFQRISTCARGSGPLADSRLSWPSCPSRSTNSSAWPGSSIAHRSIARLLLCPSSWRLRGGGSPARSSPIEASSVPFSSRRSWALVRRRRAVIQRVGLATSVADSLVLDAASAFVELRVGELHDVKGVSHLDNLGQDVVEDPPVGTGEIERAVGDPLPAGLSLRCQPGDRPGTSSTGHDVEELARRDIDDLGRELAVGGRDRVPHEKHFVEAESTDRPDRSGSSSRSASP